MSRRKRKLETRYAEILRDAKILTASLERAGEMLSKAARGMRDTVVGDENGMTTPSDIRETASECARIAHQCGRYPRGTKAI